MKAIILAIINQKGGVGKSTTAHALGAGLALRGYKTLLVDLDPQRNLTYSMGIDAPERTAFDLLLGEAPAACVVKTPKGDVIPAGTALAGADMTLTQTGKEYRLREALETLAGRYDFILIDTPPALGILTVNALTAATHTLIPAGADVFSLQGIGQLYATLDAVRRYTNPGLKVAGILLTRFSPRTVLSRDLLALIQDTAQRLNTRVFATQIREGIALKEAQVRREDIFTWAPASNAAADYTALLDELLPALTKTEVP